MHARGIEIRERPQKNYVKSAKFLELKISPQLFQK